MASPIGLSAGDIVTAAKLLRTVCKAFKDQHGASDDYKNVIHELDSTVLTIKQLQHLPSLPEYTPYVNAITAQAQKLLVTASQAHKNVYKFESALGEKARKGSYRAIIPKTKWALKVGPETTKRLRSIESQSSTIKSLLAQLTAILSMSGVHVGQQSLAVGNTVLESVKDEAIRSERRSELNEDFMAKTQVALQIIEKRSSATLRSVSSLSRRGLQQQIDYSAHENSPIISATFTGNSIITSANPSQLHLKQISPPWESPNIFLANPEHQHGSHIVSWPMPSILEPSSHTEMESRDISIRRRADMNAPEKNLPDWPTFNGRPLSETQIRIIVLLGLFFELFGGACVISHQLLLWVGIQMLAPAVSNILPDNILVRDVLGRKYSLPTAVFSDWPVLSAMLRSQFKDCPGLINVESGQFNMIDEDDPELPVGPSNWRAVVVRRKRFKMSVVLSQLQMNNQLCTKCGAGVRNMGVSTSACPQCGLFYRSSRIYRKRLRIEDIRREQRSLADRFLRVPAYDYKPRWKLKIIFEDRLMMASRFESEIILNDSSWVKSSDHSHQSPKSLVSQALLNKTTNISGSEKNPNAGIDKKSDWRNQKQDEIDETSESEAAPGLEEESTAVRLRELKELRHFISVCMKQDERIQDAALNGDVESLRTLASGCIDVDRNCGDWGTALVAAIMSRTDEAVSILLDAGANPLSRVGPINGPVLAATLFGTYLALNVVLEEASMQRGSQIFQEVIDKALFAAVDDSRLEQADALLYAGGNPFSQDADQRSAFSISVGKGNTRLSENFVAEAWGRGLLTRIETQHITATLRSTPLSAALLDPWIEACCLNLQMQRTQMVEKQIASRLSQNATFSSLIPHWRYRSSPSTSTQRTKQHVGPSHDDKNLLRPGQPHENIEFPEIRVTFAGV